MPYRNEGVWLFDHCLTANACSRQGLKVSSLIVVSWAFHTKFSNSSFLRAFSLSARNDSSYCLFISSNSLVLSAEVPINDLLEGVLVKSANDGKHSGRFGISKSWLN